MDVESIIDQESLKAWLVALPVEQQREAAIYIASRAVLRVLPFPLCDRRYWGSNGKSPLLPLLRVIALLEVASAFKSIEFATRNHALRIKLDRAAKDAEAEALAFVKEAGAAAARAPDDVFSNARALLAAVTVTGMASHIETRLIVAQTASAVALAAAAIVNFDTWPFVREDADRSRSLYISTQNKLWSRTHRSIPRKWDAAKKNMPRLGVTSIDGPTIETHGDWTFWVDWYEAHLAGEPLPASLLKDIVELPEDLWVNDPVELNRRVMEIYEAWKPSPQASAAIADFTYDPVKDWMNMVGFDGETAHIKDPDKAEAFFDDAEELRDGLQDFADFSADLRSGNNVGPILTTMSEKLLRELKRIDDKKVIRPGRWIELSGLLYSASLEQRNRDRLGDTLCLSLDTNLGRLRNLTKQHFSKTVERLEALNGLEMGPVAPSDMIARFEEVLDRIAAEDGTDFARLNP
ncbi:MAG: hypothetical protein AAF683_15980, partial [Pseudomonadota bacterium]